MHTNCRLILFTRYPEPGITKTRLIPVLGSSGAAQLQRVLTEKVSNELKHLRQRFNIPATVHFSGGSVEQMTHWLGSPFVYVKQISGDIGLKMSHAFLSTFQEGIETVVLIGSDTPDITADLLGQAFTALLTSDVVIGPSLDGGYYLIGFKTSSATHLLPIIFQNIPWSTKDVLPTTISRLNQSGYTYSLQPILQDIDLPENLIYAKEKGLL
jgi:rSAM/selenodomain-associated transferase 1